MCKTIFGGNPVMAKELIKDRRNSHIGFFFLSLGFMLQTLSIILQLLMVKKRPMGGAQFFGSPNGNHFIIFRQG